MPTDIRLWRLEAEKPVSVPQQKLDFESRLEHWLRQNISLISSNLLIIGQQVETTYGGYIDLLALDSVGNLVILELKRDKTPRDIVAQALDYASWVQDLGHEAIDEIANEFLKPVELEQAFRERFRAELPDVLNERHRMYIVASTLDSATERIVKYLSETHDVDINVATFAYFKPGEQEFLGRSFLLDETDVQDRAETKSKRKPARTWEELRGLAESKGVVALYDMALSGLELLFDGKNRTRTNVALVGIMGESKSRNVITGIYPRSSNSTDGLAIMFFLDRLCEYMNMSRADLDPVLVSPARNAATYDPGATWYFDEEKLNSLIGILTSAKRSKGKVVS